MQARKVALHIDIVVLLSKIIQILLAPLIPNIVEIQNVENLPQKFFGKVKLQNLGFGNFQLTNLMNFNHSLKLSWISKIQKLQGIWACFPKKYGIPQLMYFGKNYAKVLFVKIQNVS